MDYQDLRQSPVWDVQEGFGGSGNISFGESHFEGYCVTEGPFANLEIPYAKLDYSPHCLSRGFVDSDALVITSQNVTPKAVEAVLHKSDYEEFLLELEDGPHLSIPKTVRGDFVLFSAPAGKTQLISKSP